MDELFELAPLPFEPYSPLHQWDLPPLPPLPAIDIYQERQDLKTVELQVYANVQNPASLNATRVRVPQMLPMGQFTAAACVGAGVTVRAPNEAEMYCFNPDQATNLVYRVRHPAHLRSTGEHVILVVPPSTLKLLFAPPEVTVRLNSHIMPVIEDLPPPGDGRQRRDAVQMRLLEEGETIPAEPQKKKEEPSVATEFKLLPLYQKRPPRKKQKLGNEGESNKKKQKKDKKIKRMLHKKCMSISAIVQQLRDFRARQQQRGLSLVTFNSTYVLHSRLEKAETLSPGFAAKMDLAQTGVRGAHLEAKRIIAVAAAPGPPAALEPLPLPPAPAPLPVPSPKPKPKPKLKTRKRKRVAVEEGESEVPTDYSEEDSEY